ncbi:MAG TPA: class I SAM-dependent methyltransferase [Acidimicrobiales bacterium]|nr:class I SAM-dependent methyltransferase [Acidimicrobiales bacterium]
MRRTVRPVPADAYDEDYYLTCCAGSAEWDRQGGMSPMYDGYAARAAIRSGEVVVDVGTGRAEMLVAARRAGASLAVGLEYSAAALRLAGTTLAAATEGEAAVDGGCAAVAADGGRVPLRGGFADLVTFLDVVEHLTPAQLDASLAEAVRVLRPGGRVLIHTFPTRTLYEVTYRLQRLAVPGRRRRWPADPRNDAERAMHVNEQTLGGLRSALRRAGFEQVTVRPGEWLHTAHLPDGEGAALYGRLARFGPTARYGVADLWATGRRPPSTLS